MDGIGYVIYIRISNIPEKAYEYIVNGSSAIGWIIDWYQVKTDKKSVITDDSNDYSGDEKHIFKLLLRIINVTIQTVDLINSLPKFEVLIRRWIRCLKCICLLLFKFNFQ